MSNVEALSQLLVETAIHHGAYEAVAPPHAWPDWYAAYMDARHTGSTPDEASAAAGRYTFHDSRADIELRAGKLGEQVGEARADAGLAVEHTRRALSRMVGDGGRVTGRRRRRDVPVPRREIVL